MYIVFLCALKAMGLALWMYIFLCPAVGCVFAQMGYYDGMILLLTKVTGDLEDSV